MIFPPALLQHALAMWMQFQQFVSAAPVDADVARESLKTLTLQLMTFSCDPQPFGLFKPEEQPTFFQAPDACAKIHDPGRSGFPVIYQLIQRRNMSGRCGHSAF